MPNPNSPIYRAAFEAHKCARCRTHYVTIPGSMCGFCDRIVVDQARRDAIEYYSCEANCAPQNTTLDLFGC
jgi:uncharacterized radical SAM superfamily Fe-S cluster-containing enzyme